MPGLRGLSETVRMTLCVFVFGILAFNPLGMIFDSGMDSADSESMHGAGRVLQSTEEDGAGKLS